MIRLGPRARLYRSSDRALSRLTRTLTVVHQGLWLGLLDGEALREATALHYEGAEIFHDPDHNRSGLRPWEARIVDQYFAGCRSVLVGAVGGGREALALARRGFAVDAFECSDALLAQARRLVAEEGVGVRVLEAAPDHAPDSCGLYDGVIVGSGGYTHIAGAARRIRFLRELRGHVRDAGPVLLSFCMRGPTGLGPPLVWRIARLLRRLRGSSEPVELGDALFGSFLHHFTEGEIRRELGEGGFRLLDYSRHGYAVGEAV